MSNNRNSGGDGAALVLIMIIAVVVVVAAITVATITIGAVYGSGKAIFNYGKAVNNNVALERPQLA